MIIFYLLFIIGAIALTLTSSLKKKESFLSIACDLSLMLIVFYWGIENIVLTIVGTILILAIYFMITYFAIVKKANLEKVSQKLVEQAKIGSFKTYLSIAFILFPLTTKSEVVMIVCLFVYIIIDRTFFFYKYRSLI